MTRRCCRTLSGESSEACPAAPAGGGGSGGLGRVAAPGMRDAGCQSFHLPVPLPPARTGPSGSPHQGSVRYGYRRVHVHLQREGWSVNHKKVHRIYNELGLQLRKKRPKCRNSQLYLWSKNKTWEELPLPQDIAASVPEVTSVMCGCSLRVKVLDQRLQQGRCGHVFGLVVRPARSRTMMSSAVRAPDQSDALRDALTDTVSLATGLPICCCHRFSGAFSLLSASRAGRS